MNVSTFLLKAKTKKKISSKIRLYLIDKNKHYFLNDGISKNGFDSKLTITKSEPIVDNSNLIIII